MPSQKYLRYSSRVNRDAGFAAFFAGRSGCEKFDCFPNDDYHEDGVFELTNLREGYYIAMPPALYDAWQVAAERAKRENVAPGPAKNAIFSAALAEAKE